MKTCNKCKYLIGQNCTLTIAWKKIPNPLFFSCKSFDEKEDPEKKFSPEGKLSLRRRETYNRKDVS